METIILSAIKISDTGVCISLHPYSRHNYIIRDLIELGADPPIKQDVQGFITSTGRFVNRKEAYKLAIAANQIEKSITNNILTSEDVW